MPKYTKRRRVHRKTRRHGRKKTLRVRRGSRRGGINTTDVKLAGETITSAAKETLREAGRRVSAAVGTVAVAAQTGYNVRNASNPNEAFNAARMGYKGLQKRVVLS